MQWLLQEFDDTRRLALALDRLNTPYSWHRVVPFAGDLEPEPLIADSSAVMLFGSYSLWRYAKKRGLFPGVFKLEPFVEQEEWRPFLLNGPDADIRILADLPETLEDDGRKWFVRPVEDSKEIAGSVKTSAEILEMARSVLSVPADEIPNGSLRHDTKLMLCEPATILKEWRVWIVDGRVITWSLYKEGDRVIHRHEIDDDARAFAKSMADRHPGYARAYVIDVCRTREGLRLIETNCINSAGLYAADLKQLAVALNGTGGA